MDATTDYLTVSQICRRLPGARGGKRLHPSTVVQWIVAGCPGRDRNRVKLAATRAGSRWLVRQSDLDAFFERLAGNTGDVPDPPVRTPAQRLRASERAAERLERMGY